jgi:hypothetical protein
MCADFPAFVQQKTLKKQLPERFELLEQDSNL